VSGELKPTLAVPFVNTLHDSSDPMGKRGTHRGGTSPSLREIRSLVSLISNFGIGIDLF